MTPEQRQLLGEFEGFVARATSAQALMKEIVERLHTKMSRYNWCGFYLVDPTDANYLIVGPFSGSFTPNERIPLNRGLCGAAAMTGKSVIVPDVSKDPRYLQGSNMVKSEMVVPIFAKKKLVGELDVESYFLETFGAADQEFVEASAAMVGRYAETAGSLTGK
jgi:L-methionine (R)-S-oxide reductase